MKLFILISSSILFSACKPRQDHSELQIINGIQVPPFEFPLAGEFTADMNVYKVDASGNQRLYREISNLGTCSGRMICDNVVLTAAHCVTTYFKENSENKTDKSIVVRDQKYSFELDLMPEKIPFDPNLNGTVAIHPKYTAELSNAPYDLALVKLSRPFQDFAKWNWYPLAQERVNNPNEKLIPVSYGNKTGLFSIDYTSNVKRKGFLDFTGYKSQAIEYDGVTTHRLNGEMLVGEQGQQKLCYGDSGGPVFVQNGAGYTQTGISSMGDDRISTWFKYLTGFDTANETMNECSYVKNMLFTSVPDHYEWIVSTASQMCNDPSQIENVSQPGEIPLANLRRKLHVTTFRPNRDQKKKIMCTYLNNNRGVISDVNINTIGAGEVTISYSLYNEEALMFPWSNSPEYTLSINALKALGLSPYDEQPQVNFETMKELLGTHIQKIATDQAEMYSQNRNWKIKSCFLVE